MGAEMKTLILKSDRGDFEKFYIEHMQKKKITTVPYYKNLGTLLRYMAVIYVQKLKLPFSSIWYGSWKKDVKKYKNIILFDRNFNWNVIEYIHRRNPACRIIVWYWNPITEKKRIPFKYREFCEEWSFNPNDCIRYKLKYNTQFSFNTIGKDCPEEKIYDLYFVGIDKGRGQYLEKLKNVFEKIGKKSKYVVVRDKKSQKNRNFEYSTPISYLENLENLKKSYCIAEIVQNGQEGLTVRCIEALFMKKKIITNNRAIVQYDFYNKNNILLLNMDQISIENIKKFLSLQYVDIDYKITQKYEFTQWLKNFNIEI